VSYKYNDTNSNIQRYKSMTFLPPVLYSTQNIGEVNCITPIADLMYNDLDSFKYGINLK